MSSAVRFVTTKFTSSYPSPTPPPPHPSSWISHHYSILIMQLWNSTDPDSQGKIEPTGSILAILPLLNSISPLCRHFWAFVCSNDQSDLLPYPFSLNRVCLFITCIYYENLCYSIVCMEMKINISYLILSYFDKNAIFIIFYFKKNDFIFIL
jgi:hypothetical protein